MLLVKTEITPLIGSSLSIQIRDQRFLQSPFHNQPSFHAHPEIELVYVISGFGKRIVGEVIEDFEPGDMVLIGVNVPHVWLSDKLFYDGDASLKSKVIVTYFNPQAFRTVFDNVSEFEHIKHVINRASHGIKITGETRKNVAASLLEMPSMSGIDKMQTFLKILNTIATSPETSNIENNEISDDNIQNIDRLITVINYIKNNFHNEIYLRDVASKACMTEQSFSRYFHSRTKKCFSDYLTDIRIQHACKLLIQSDDTISEVAYQCGYRSPSHFCRIFREQIKVSPYKYKRGLPQ